MSIKDTLYNLVVRKNENVRYEYERYVMEHTIEHYENRGKHWKILWKLNWHYRVKKKKEPMMYWDRIIEIKKNHETKKNSTVYQENRAVAPKQMQNSEKIQKKVEDTYLLEFLKEAKHKNPIEFAEFICKYDVISFDIFDTLILRKVDDPKIVFDIVGLRLGIAGYRELREQASKEAKKYTLKHNAEADIFEICEKLSEYIGIRKEILVETEFQVEMDYCFANPYFKEVFNNIECKKVVATSDMYWPEPYIRKLLENFGYYIEEIFVSCDYECGKRSGELQNCVMHKKGKRKKYIHIGDSIIADITPSREYGWDTIHYYNNQFAGNKYRVQGLKSVSSSIYKGIVNTYIHCGVNEYNKYFEHGFVNAGYLAYSFCEWIEEKAVRDNIDNIVFLGRDCDVIYKIYNKYFTQIKSSYMKFSRFLSDSLLFAEMPEVYIKNNIKKRAFWPEKDRIIISELLEQLDLSFLNDKLEKYNLNGEDIASISNYDKIRSLIYGEKEKISEHFQDMQQASKKYFQQIIGDDSNILVVDLGWKGSSLFSINYIVNNIWGLNKVIKGALLMGDIDPYLARLEEKKFIEVYVCSNEKNRNIIGSDLARYNMYKLFVEATYSSAEPTVLKCGLNKKNNIEFEYGLLNACSQDISDMHEGMMKFAELYHSAIKNDKNNIKSNAIDANLPLYKKLSDFKYSDYMFGKFVEALNSTQGYGEDLKIEDIHSVLVKRGYI